MMKKLVCLLTVFTLLFSATALAAPPSVAELFRYVPTQVIVEGKEVNVKGYFVNMSGSTITGLTDGELDMVVYLDDRILLSKGSFSGSNLETLHLNSYDMVAWTFTWSSGGEGFNDGIYDTDSNCYALMDCTVCYRN